MLLHVGTLCVAGYVKNAIGGTCYHTSDRQEHRLIQHAGPERETTIHLHVTTWQRPSRQAVSLGSSTGAGDFVLQLNRLESLWNVLQVCQRASSLADHHVH